MMDAYEQTTGTRDVHYNLVSVLYHALQGADTCNVYALDAEAAGDERLAAFFREAGVVQTQLAERAKGLLGIVGGVAPGVGRVAAPRTAEPETAVPPEGVVGPGAAVTDVRRGTELEPPPPGTGRVPSREESVAGDVPLRTEPSLAREGMEEARHRGQKSARRVRKAPRRHPEQKTSRLGRKNPHRLDERTPVGSRRRRTGGC